MHLIWSLTILLGLMTWSLQCCILKNGRRCRFSDPSSDPSLVFGGRMVFDTPTGTLNGKPMENEKHIIIIQQPRFKMTGFSFPVPFGGSGLGKVWRVPDSNSATFCKASPIPDADCFLPPGPPRNVQVDVNRRTQHGIQIVWKLPTVTKGNILKYEFRYRAIERPYDSSFKEEYFQETSVLAHTLQNTEYFLGNLDPATKYEVQLSALTFLKRGPCVTITGSTSAARDLTPVDVNALPPVNRTDGKRGVIYLPPLKQKYATGYIIRVVLVRGRDRVPEIDYRAAFINKTDEITEFTIGDGEQYGVYNNRPLREDENYEVYIGVVSKVGEDESITWSDPIFIPAYVKKPLPVGLILIVGSLVVACTFAMIAIIIFSRRTRDSNRKRIKKGNRRNLALPEIPTEGERYKLFTSSTKSQENGLHVPIFDPYGVDFAQDSEEIRTSNKQAPNGKSAVSTGTDIARIQNRRLPEKPPLIPDTPAVTLGTYVKPQPRHTLDKLEGAAAETDGMTRQIYRSEDEKTKRSTAAFQDEYDDTDIDKVTERKKSKKDKQKGMAMSTFPRLAGKTETTSNDFGDMYDDTDIDRVVGGKKDSDLPPRNNENRYSKFGPGENSISEIYEDSLGSLESSTGAPATLIADVYEENETLTEDDFYDDTEEMLSQEKEPSTESRGGEDGKKAEKNKTNKKWFQWKRKDVSVTTNLGKNNTKTVPAAEVSPLEKTLVSYSSQLYPLSSIKTDKTPGEFVEGKQADDDQYNDIYEDTTQMNKKEHKLDTVTHPRPPSNPPQWTGMMRNNTAQNNTFQPKEDRELGDIKDYGDEYDETAVESDSKVTMTTAPPVPFPPKPVQVVIPSTLSMVENSKIDFHGNAEDDSDEDLYEETEELEMYDDTCVPDHGEELYEAIETRA